MGKGTCDNPLTRLVNMTNRTLSAPIGDKPSANQQTNKPSLSRPPTHPKAPTTSKSQGQTQQGQGQSGVKAKTALELEVEALLGKRSSHAGEAEDEWFQGFEQRVDKLARREAAAAKANEVQALHIRAFCCRQCNFLAEMANPVCRDRGHPVDTVTVVKRFFECLRCRRRDSTLGQPAQALPKARCSCGAYEWVRCGKGGTGATSSIIPKMVMMAGDGWCSSQEVGVIKEMSMGAE